MTCHAEKVRRKQHIFLWETLLDYKLSFTMGLAWLVWHMQMPKQLNGSWGTQQYHRLLGAQKRLWGERNDSFVKTWLTPHVRVSSRLFPMIPRPLPKVRGCTECDVCMCVRGPWMQTWKVILRGRFISFHSPSFSENCKYGIEMVGRSSKLDSVGWTPTSYRVA